MKRELFLGLLIGMVCMGLAFWGVPLDGFLDALLRLRPGWFLAFALLFVAQTGLQASRQRLLLPGLPLRFADSLSVVLIGFFAIQTLPVRLGELARPWLLRRNHQLPLGEGFGMVAIERALDLLALLLALAAVLLWVDIPSAELVLGGLSIDLAGWGWQTGRVVIPLVTLVVVGLAVAGEPLMARIAPLVRAAARPLGAARLAEGLVDFGRAFILAFRALREPLRLLGVLALTAAIWLDIAGMYWALSWGFGLQDPIGYGESAGVMSITALGSLLPSPPGMAGVQEAFGRAALALFGVRGEASATALSYAVVAHWGQYLLCAAGAAAFALRAGVGLREVFAGARSTAAEREAP